MGGAWRGGHQASEIRAMVALRCGRGVTSPVSSRGEKVGVSVGRGCYSTGCRNSGSLRPPACLLFHVLLGGLGLT